MRAGPGRQAIVCSVLAALCGCGDAGQPGTGSSDAGALTPSAAASSAGMSAAEPSSSAARSSSRALVLGRKMATDGRWAEAVKAFEEAAAEEPPNPYAFSELGWAALHAGDLDRSLSASERGLSLSEDPKVRAMLIYNRGRVQEERGQKDDARASYEESLKLRPNDAVKKRLEELGGKAPPPPELHVVCDRMFGTLREACACLVDARKELGLPQDAEGSCAALPVESRLDGRPLEVVRVASGSESVVWVLADVKGRLRPVMEVTGEDVVARKLLLPIEGDRTVVGLLLSRLSTDSGKTVRTTAELLCLVGDRKGAPTCPVEVVHAVAELKDGIPNPDRTVTLARTIRSNGKVEVKRQGGPVDLIPAGALGTHALW